MRLFCVLIGCAAVAAQLEATPLFVTGDLIWGTATSKIFEISTASSGQNLASATPFANLNQASYGQLAFSADATTAYMAMWDSNSVVAISNTGQVTTYATGITNPIGIIRTSSGKLLVSSWTDGKIYDITGGGNFSAATPYASGLVNPNGMLETPNGILVAEETADRLKYLGNGGDLSQTAPFATMTMPLALAYANNRIYATAYSLYQVFDITNGGAINMTAPFAKGRRFSSLTVANNKLYSGTEATTVATSGIWDITNGGNFSTATALAYNLPISSSVLLTTVPMAQIVSASIPEAGTTALAGTGLLLLSVAGVRRRSR